MDSSDIYLHSSTLSHFHRLKWTTPEKSQMGLGYPINMNMKKVINDLSPNLSDQK